MLLLAVICTIVKLLLVTGEEIGELLILILTECILCGFSYFRWLIIIFAVCDNTLLLWLRWCLKNRRELVRFLLGWRDGLNERDIGHLRDARTLQLFRHHVLLQSLIFRAIDLWMNQGCRRALQFLAFTSEAASTTCNLVLLLLNRAQLGYFDHSGFAGRTCQ